MAITLDGTTGISSVDGSSSSPSVRGADANSGIVYAADTVKISTGGTERLEVDSSGNIDIPDNGKIRLGGSGDLSLYHDGSHSKIKNSTGFLVLESDSFALNNGAGTENIIRGFGDGACELYFNGTKMIETGQYGVTMSEHLYMLDTKKIYVGAGADLVVYHSSDVNYLDSRGREILIRNTNTDGNATETMAKFTPNGAVKIYFDAVKKIETTGSGVTVQGSVTETSDVALKEDITPLSNSLTNLKQLTGYSYKFKDTGVKSLGLTAQEVEKVYPDLVEGEEGQKGLNYSGLIAPLLEAVKELSTEIETLKTKVAALEAG